MIRCASVVVAMVSLAGLVVSCGGEIEPGSAIAEQAVAAATLRLASAPGSAADFGTVALGSSLNESFVVTNAGTRQTSSPLNLTLTGGAGFSLLTPVAGDCASGSTMLRPGQACRVRVRFAPASPGPQSATLGVTARAGGSVRLTLSGLGQGPGLLVVSPVNFAFPPVVLGALSAVQLFTVTNAGGGTTGPLTVAVTGGAATDFPISAPSAGACSGGSLPGGASCIIAISFAPTIAGLRTAQLNVAAAPGGSVAVPLAGSGLRPAALLITPSSFSFGSVPVGATSDVAVFTLTNIGDSATGVPTAFLTGAADFIITSSTCSSGLPVATTCAIGLVFRPAAAGVHTGTLQVSASPGGAVAVAVAGAGI